MDQSQKLLEIVAENPTATQGQYAEQPGVSKRTISRIFKDLQERGMLKQQGTRRKAKWVIVEKR
ncbi:MAG: winged helix-turn-helix transcriptional regulator [Lachnospiraceae bacterium]|nr:winged helix-turn-helix transcriptional regulator [Lachnospiraceae bacterium]